MGGQSPLQCTGLASSATPRHLARATLDMSSDCASHCLVLIPQAAARLRVRGHTGHRAVTYFVVASATIGFGLLLRFAADLVKADA
jgi:hypothetical protein